MPGRPAHRPSRRSDVIDAAVGLFAAYPVDTITVADIASAADMTAAAVYYHFPSKEGILLEGLKTFTAAYLTELRRCLPTGPEPRWERRLVSELLGWCEQHRASATVFFASSAGLDTSIEALRREVDS